MQAARHNITDRQVLMNLCSKTFILLFHNYHDLHLWAASKPILTIDVLRCRLLRHLEDTEEL